MRKNIFKQSSDVNVWFIFLYFILKKESLLKLALKRFFNILMVLCLRKKLRDCILYALLAVFDTWGILYACTILKTFASVTNVNWYAFFLSTLRLRWHLEIMELVTCKWIQVSRQNYLKYMQSNIFRILDNPKSMSF